MTTKKKRRDHLRSAFVTTVASAAVVALASGCESKVTIACSDGECGQGGGSSSQSSGTVKPIGCPDLVPSTGTWCTERGLSCTYDVEDDCGSTQEATCGPDGTWLVEFTHVSCNPPPCPPDRPATGEDCIAPWEGSCEYEGSCPSPDVYQCIDGKWQDLSPTCNPPPPSACLQLNAQQCDSTPSCEWMHPGCGDLIALPEPSCHPRDVPCDQNPWVCTGDTSCQAVSIDPCANKNCQACHEIAWLCLPGATADPDEP